jgi:hypothetical protein
VASDADAHDKAQRDVTDSLEDLEKAERKLSEKQRDLDETREKARAAGDAVRIDNDNNEQRTTSNGNRSLD